MSSRGVGVAVIGMHRSGTSVVTRAINLLGVPLCSESDLVPGSRGNQLGHWESGTLVRANDQLLRAVGATWWCPPQPNGRLWARGTFERRWHRARTAFDAAHPTPQWVTKDPRMSLTLPFWRSALEHRLVVVLAVRPPLDIARSLERRNGFPIRLGLALWERYMHHALPALVGLPVLVTPYDELVSDPVAWSDSACEFFTATGVAVTTAGMAITAVADPGQRHAFGHGALDAEAEVSGSQRELALALAGLDSSLSFDPPSMPAETPTTAEMFARLRRRYGLSLGWRWRRAILRDRHQVVIRESDL